MEDTIRHFVIKVLVERFVFAEGKRFVVDGKQNRFKFCHYKYDV